MPPSSLPLSSTVPYVLVCADALKLQIKYNARNKSDISVPCKPFPFLLAAESLAYLPTTASGFPSGDSWGGVIN